MPPPSLLAVAAATNAGASQSVPPPPPPPQSPADGRSYLDSDADRLTSGNSLEATAPPTEKELLATFGIGT